MLLSPERRGDMFRFSLLAVSSVLCLLAQTTPAPQPNAAASDPIIVEGKVVSATTGENLRKVTVRLQPLSTQQQSPYVASTDAEGVFHFDHIDPGTYRLSGEKAGFLNGFFGSRKALMIGTNIKVNAGQKLTGLDFALTPEARLTGRVLDEDGDPVGRCVVQVLRYAQVRG